MALAALEETALIPGPVERIAGPERERVLLVDDEPQVLVALEDLLSEEFIVLKTESAEAALELADVERNIAVVLTDQRMPQMCGDELLSKLALSSPAARILVTGFADLSAVMRAVNEGKIFAYVTKPWAPEDLKLKVHQAAEHFRLTKELMHERQLLNQVLDSMDEGVVALNPGGEILLFNRQAERILGKRADEVTPKSWVFACGAHLPDQKTLLPELQNPLLLAAAGQPMKETEIYIKNRNVAGVEVAVAAMPLRDEEQTGIGGVVVFRDVTERRRLERELGQAQKMEAIGQLAGGVAHDFNNLLAVITGYGELLQQEFAPGDPKHDDMGQLLSAAQRAAALTRQLLAFSRRQVIQPRILDVNEVISDVEKMLVRIIGEDIDLKTVLAPRLGLVRADPSQIEQVILNLTVNARDAMPKGGKLTIETASAGFDEEYPIGDATIPAGEYVMLAVADTGSGMDADTRKHIFEPFFTTKEPGRGTGLGLATVYGIVKQCEGHILVYTELGRGTSFKIYLPQAESGQSLSSPPPRRAQSVAARAATILIVEDDDAVRQVTVRILKGRGYTVFEARTASEARAVCEEHGATIDLLLTDVVMPEVSGPQLAEELSGKQPGMRVLYMSGYSGAAVTHHGALAAGVAWLEKPFTSASLSVKVRETLGFDE